MTKQDYENYKKSVEDFFSDEGLENLSAVGDENGLIEPYFSWCRCDCCKTQTGGDRYYCNGYNPTTKEVQTYSFVCGDCVYYAEYGRLDDQTMELIESFSGETHDGERNREQSVGSVLG